MPKAAFAEDQISSSYMHNYNYKIKSEILFTSSYLIFTAGFLAFLNVLVCATVQEKESNHTSNQSWKMNKEN